MATTASTTRDAVVEAGRTLKRQVYLQPAGSAHLEKIPEDWTRTPDHDSQTQLRSEKTHLERLRGEMLMEAAAIDAPPRGLQGQRDPGTTPLPVVRDGAEPLAAAAATASRDFDLSATGTVRRKSDLDAFKRQLLTHGEPSSATLRDATAAVAATSTGLPASPQRHRLGSTGSPAGTAKFASLSSPLRPNTHAGSRMAASSASSSFAGTGAGTGVAVVAPYAQDPYEHRGYGQHDGAGYDEGLSNTAALLADAADRGGHAGTGDAAVASGHHHHGHSQSSSPTRRPRTSAAYNHVRYGAGDTTVGSVSISSASQWPHRDAHLVSMGNGGFLTRPGEDNAYGTALISGRKGGAAGGGPTPHAPYAPPLQYGAGPGDGLEEPAILPDNMIKVRAARQRCYTRLFCSDSLCTPRVCVRLRLFCDFLPAFASSSVPSRYCSPLLAPATPMPDRGKLHARPLGQAPVARGASSRRRALRCMTCERLQSATSLLMDWQPRLTAPSQLQRRLAWACQLLWPARLQRRHRSVARAQMGELHCRRGKTSQPRHPP